ncbi:MAG TPA: tRNA lysidine(34) synthetase TilS [Gemmatimonadaceae bacterium]|nr:tRNA lysidine(34) synthetase TilS [Gemmatimonadaceae bacterium]
MSIRETSSIRQSVRAAFTPHARVVLAISGGLDSMVLLDAAAHAVPRDKLIVATFDHGTGMAAATARAEVQRRAASLGIPCESDRATDTLRTEAELRDARWAFLRRVAAGHNAVVSTAHTADDQIETVVMRTLRDAGARGLAGLFAPSPHLRPLLRTSRREVTAYARAEGLQWVEDPSNMSPDYFRNRVRHDLLPAMRRGRPTIERELVSLARKAARWRADVELYVDDLGLHVFEGGRGVDVQAAALESRREGELAVLWPAIAARGGAVLDRRGVERLAAFTRLNRVGARIPLAGGWVVVRSREAFQLRPSASEKPTPAAIALLNDTRWGDWSFVPRDEKNDHNGNNRHNGHHDDSWTAWLPADEPLLVRPWLPGDAMVIRDGAPPRKVKHYLSDAGVTGHERAGWPVVLAGDRIVWIPGVRRSDAATARPGRPGLPFICEYIHR